MRLKLAPETQHRVWKNLRNYSVRGIFYTRFLTTHAPLSALLGEGLFCVLASVRQTLETGFIILGIT
ncbi:hypothetical protein, partial [Bifidobacterium pseudocatenulatum]